jgi:AcrR family transcriptional regulator
MQTKNRLSNNPAGRPRSGDVTDRIHAAVLSLMKNGSYGDLSIEAIAAKAGVSRPALYRRYATVGQITLGALQAAGSTILPMRQTTNVRRDLCLYFNSLVTSIAAETVTGRALRGVLASALTDPAFGPHFARFIEKRREPVRQRLAQWNESLEAAQMEEALDAMFGPILYRLLIRRVTADGRQISRIVNHVLSGIKCKS